MKKPNPKLKKFLIETAVGAGNVLLKYYLKIHNIRIKEGAGIVTEADKASEDYVIKRIRKAYPKSDIIAEESGESLKDNAMCWVIDPLDGTSNYASQFPYFCVSIGLQENGKARAGVVYNPLLKEMFFAEKGCGAYLNNKKITVSKAKDPQEALLGTGFYYVKGQTLKAETEIFGRMNEIALGVRRPGAAALDLAYVACGRYAGFWEKGLSSWDVAAGYLLIEEAGGKITNYSGGPTTIFDREVVASNSLVHDIMVKTIQGE